MLARLGSVVIQLRLQLRLEPESPSFRTKFGGGVGRCCESLPQCDRHLKNEIGNFCAERKVRWKSVAVIVLHDTSQSSETRSEFKEFATQKTEPDPI
ncbi:hypothetical protein [Oscillatoria sp. FACHB-1406]|uniref:hypothetical protein n=1 Tax=Oscillatoria sp. FACHB-1406 TaxID=2692846 RepID=UPI001689C456|nr:hypothetical protein [Oscillatoria sp. FACHB-1406]